MLARDPMCGKAVQVEGSGTPAAEYKSRKYFFCSDRCRSAFCHRTEQLRVRELARAGALLSPGGVRWALA